MDLADYQPSEHMLVIRHAKGNRDREADLTDRAEQYLHEWLAIRGDEAGPLFCRIRKNGALVQGRPLTAQAVYNVLKKRAAQAGIDELFTPHDFRRTFVSNLLEAGADLATVSKMAGHANVQTTAKYDRRDREARRKVAALIKVP
jgi:site-specific recombinase XerD